MYRLYMYIVWISIYKYITYLQVYNIYIYNYVHAQVYIAGSEHHGREYDPLQSLIEVKPKIWKLPTSHPSKWKTEHPKFFKVLTQTSLRCMFTFWNWTIAILCHLASIIPCLRRSRFGIRQAHPEDISSKPLKLKPLSWWIKIVLYGTKLRPKTHLHRGDVSLKKCKGNHQGQWNFMIPDCGLVKLSLAKYLLRVVPFRNNGWAHVKTRTFVIIVKLLAFILRGFRPAFIRILGAPPSCQEWTVQLEN